MVSKAAQSSAIIAFLNNYLPETGCQLPTNFSLLPQEHALEKFSGVLHLYIMVYMLNCVIRHLFQTPLRVPSFIEEAGQQNITFPRLHFTWSCKCNLGPTIWIHLPAC